MEPATRLNVGFRWRGGTRGGLCRQRTWNRPARLPSQNNPWCSWISGALRDSGFVVVEAADVEEAQAVLQSMPEIEAVFADIVLPRQGSAAELVTWMGEEMPDIPVILTSGQTTMPAAITLSSCPNVTDFVPKPYGADAVQRLLRERIMLRR